MYLDKLKNASQPFFEKFQDYKEWFRDIKVVIDEQNSSLKIYKPKVFDISGTYLGESVYSESIILENAYWIFVIFLNEVYNLNNDAAEKLADKIYDEYEKKEGA